jgi:menaquinone-dependent protoporphyrinogen oxidase
MWMTKGPTDPTAVIEFTDWQKVDAFAQLISEM